MGNGPRVSGVRSPLWFIPVMCVLAGVVLTIGTITIDRLTGFDLIPRWMTGGPDAALGILTTIAVSMVSLATLVLTITMVVVQLAMGQFSPRIVQTILQDKPSQLAIGLFIATFAHAMLSLREVGFDEPVTVPGLAIVVSYVLVLVSIVVLVLYVHHIGRSLRVSALIELVGSDTRRLLDDVYPADEEFMAADQICSPRSGVLVHIDHERLVAAAREADCILELVPAMGEYVAAGTPLLRVDGDRSRLPDDLDGALVLGLERTLDQDVAYGFRMLVDIAERSLSDSSYLDPTTAVQAIDRLHDNLRHLARRRFPDGTYRDADGRLRLVMRVMTWKAYVHLAFDEIRQAGADSPQVARRLRAALDDLVSYAPVKRRAVLFDQLALLDQAINERVPEQERDAYMEADRQGIGVAAGGMAGKPASARVVELRRRDFPD